MTRAIIPSFATVLGLVVLTACAASYEPPLPEPASADQASIERGHQLAEHSCSTCHAIGASSERRHPAAPPFRTLSRNYPANDLAEGTLVGHRNMPEFHFDPNHIDDLVNYLQSIQDHRSG